MSAPTSPAPAAPAAPPAQPPPPAGHTLAIAWARANPVAAGLLGAFLGVLALFYCAIPLFPAANKHLLTPLAWIRAAWNPETHYEHGPLVPLIILFLVWNALPKLRGTVPQPTMLGLLPLLFGVGLYLLGVRALQPRITWAALPFIPLGRRALRGGPAGPRLPCSSRLPACSS